MTPEGKLQKDVITYLKSLDKCWFQKNIKTNRNGIPDITGCLAGKHFAIELKAPNKDFTAMSKLQKIELKKIVDAGGMGFYANNLPYIKNIFENTLIEL